MHFFLYEWVTGGGLVEEPGPLSRSFLTEGTAILTALAADFLAIDGSRVSVLRDIRADELVLPGCEAIEVHSREHQREEFAQLTAKADHTLVIAPETDNVLLQTNAMVREAGGRLLAASDPFVELTSDKHLTAECLAKAGVPVPEAIFLEADQESLPAEFPYPAVLKPVHGAGSQHTMLVTNARDETPPYSWPCRLERFYPGIATSVSFLCGPAHRVPLPACRQHLASDGRFTYTGGSRLSEKELACRATALADRALDSLPPAAGYVGVDLVLGSSADGSEDVVVEVNPRLTTSYVGLRAIAQDNLAAAMLENAAGRIVSPRFSHHGVEFHSDGTVSQPQES
jgi:predicted ATP-grasp superfamily ATP-dependent carboligase